MESFRTVDPEEIARFSKIAGAWWDPHGKFKPLHVMAPQRLGYLRERICAHFGRNPATPRPLEGLRLVDIGCGGGLICEPLTRLGARMTGLDASEKNIHVAALHAHQGGLEIDYRNTTAEALAAEGKQYDVVLALEVVEHVADVPLFLASCATLVRPGGLLLLSTLNRTAKSFALAIIGAEYVLRWLPRGTHQWKKFLRPSEVHQHLASCGLNVYDQTGLVMNPLSFEWRLDPRDLDVNYLLAARKPEA